MTKYTRLDRKTRHAADMYINVLEQLGVKDTSNKGLEIYTSPEWDKKVTEFYESHGVCDVDTVIGF